MSKVRAAIKYFHINKFQMSILGLPLYKSLSHVKNIEEVEELNVETFKKFANLILY